jgi:hypothetical protein
MATQEQFHIPFCSMLRTLSALHSIQERALVAVYQHVSLELVTVNAPKMKKSSLPQQKCSSNHVKASKSSCFEV